MIIDDDPTNNLICEASIKKVFKTADVISFLTPEDGIKYIETVYALNPVKTVLFLDINMPSLSGWEVLSKFQALLGIISPNILVYILSSSIDPADKRRADANKLVEGYIAKPLSKNKLLSLFSPPLAA